MLLIVGEDVFFFSWEESKAPEHSSAGPAQILFFTRYKSLAGSLIPLTVRKPSISEIAIMVWRGLEEAYG